MRILFKIILIVIIIAAAALLTLALVVDPNDYKQEISSQVEKATGRKLILEGDIGLSVFPWLALELGPLSLSNAEGFKADNFARVAAAEVRIKLMPLLQKQLVMDTVVLDGLVLNLEKNQAGMTNWDDLAGEEGATKPGGKAGDQPDSGGSTGLTEISIAGVKLSNASILWSDATTSEDYRLENLNLSTEPLVPGKPTTIDVNFDFISRKPSAKVAVSLSTRASVGLDKQQHRLAEIDFSAQAEGAGLPFEKAVVTLTGEINADMVKQLVTMDGLALTANANKGEQLIDASLSTHIATDLGTQKTTLKALQLRAALTDPALPGGKLDLTLATDISADMQRQTVTLSALALKVHDLLINGHIQANKILSDNPDFDGRLDIEPFNLRQLADHLTIELPPMADDSTLKLVQASAAFTGSNRQFSAKQLDMTLDQSKLRGQFAVNNFDHPAIDFKLALDEIDADRYLPAGDKQERPATQTSSTGGTTAGASEFPLETLRQINTRGTLDIGKLAINGTRSEKIHLEINAARGLIKLHPVSANLYQGLYQGNISLDARGRELKFAIQHNLKNVQISPLLKDLTGDDIISGTANNRIELSGSGSNVDQFKQTLNGSGQFSFTDGAVKGINIADSIRRAEAALKGEKPPPSDAPLKTDFSSLTGSFTVAKGVVVNKDLLAKSPLLRINGAGKIDLPKEQIDYGLKATVVGSVEGQGGRDLSELQGLTIPIKVTGDFDNPKPTVDLANLIREQASQEVKDKVADKLKDELGADLGGIVGHALGTTPAPTTPAGEGGGDSKAEQKPVESPEKQLEKALKDKFKGLF